MIVFNDAHIFLPFTIEPVPGFDRIRVAIRQVFHLIEYERGGDPFAGAGSGSTSALELICYLDDFFDLPLHGVFSCWLVTAQ